jgi:hypothetical protein
MSTEAWGVGLGVHPHALRGLALVGGALELRMNALSFHYVVFLTLYFFFAGNSGLNYSRSDLDYDGWISYVNNFPKVQRDASAQYLVHGNRTVK